jgi:hypothetical protein
MENMIPTMGENDPIPPQGGNVPRSHNGGNLVCRKPNRKYRKDTPRSRPIIWRKGKVLGKN